MIHFLRVKRELMKLIYWGNLLENLKSMGNKLRIQKIGLWITLTSEKRRVNSQFNEEYIMNSRGLDGSEMIMIGQGESDILSGCKGSSNIYEKSPKAGLASRWQWIWGERD